MVNKIEDFFTENYRKHITTLKETSYDKANNHFLCSNEDIDVFNYDKIANSRFKTCDALLFINNKIIFIEFKNCETYCNDNSDIAEKVKLSVKLKINESIMLMGLLLKSNSLIRNYSNVYDFPVYYYYVYSKEKEDKRIQEKEDDRTQEKIEINNKIRGIFNRKLYNLEKYEGKIIKAVQTIDDDVFENITLKTFIS